MTDKHQEEIKQAMGQVEEALNNIFKTGHGELVLKVADRRVVYFDYKAQWQLKKTE